MLWFFFLNIQVLFICDYTMEALIQFDRYALSCGTRIHIGYNRNYYWQKTSVCIIRIEIRITIYCRFFFLVDFRNAKNYSKLCRVLSMMSYFGLREWNFCNKNIDQLAKLLKNQSKCSNELNKSISCSRNGTHTDNQTCNLEFDMRTIDWNEYFYNYLPGIKKYFFKERLTNNKKCIKHYNRYGLFVLKFIDLLFN